MRRSDMRTFRVYTNDGNQMLFEAHDIMAVCEYVVIIENYNPADIYKIEEVNE